MARISLKNIVGKKTETRSAIPTLIDGLKCQVWIEDEKGNILAGDKKESALLEYPVQFENEVIGYVKGDEQVYIIGGLLDLLVQKEGEKKKLGTRRQICSTCLSFLKNTSKKKPPP